VVTPSAAGTYVHTVVVAPGGGLTDPAPADDRASATLEVAPATTTQPTPDGETNAGPGREASAMPDRGAQGSATRLQNCRQSTIVTARKGLSSESTVPWHRDCRFRRRPVSR